MTRPAVDYLTEDEVKTMITALLEGTAPLPVEDETINRLQEWTTSVLTQYTLLCLTLRGDLNVRWNNDEQDWTFGRTNQFENRYMA